MLGIQFIGYYNSGSKIKKKQKKVICENGGGLHKPFGHRSMLDNGWFTTKDLKKKKITGGIN